MKKQIFNFLLIGTLNTAFYYLIYATFIYIGLDYKISVFVATLIGVFFSFKTFGKYVFSNSDKKLIYKFVFIYVLLYGLNIFLINNLNRVRDNFYFSGLIAALVVAIFTFTLNKFFVFRK